MKVPLEPAGVPHFIPKCTSSELTATFLANPSLPRTNSSPNGENPLYV